MLNLDPAKLLIIAVVAVILLGPDKLPQVARQVSGGAIVADGDDSPARGAAKNSRREPLPFATAAALLELNHVAVVPGNDSGFDTHVRLSFATAIQQIDKGIDRIAEFLKSLA